MVSLIGHLSHFPVPPQNDKKTSNDLHDLAGLIDQSLNEWLSIYDRLRRKYPVRNALFPVTVLSSRGLPYSLTRSIAFPLPRYCGRPAGWPQFFTFWRNYSQYHRLAVFYDLCHPHTPMYRDESLLIDIPPMPAANHWTIEKLSPTSTTIEIPAYDLNNYLTTISNYRSDKVGKRLS